MARTSALQAEGRGFESHLLHKFLCFIMVVDRILTNFSTHNIIVITFVDKDLSILDASLAQLDRATAF